MDVKKVILILSFGVFLLAQPHGLIWASAVAVSGKAKAANTSSYLDFTNYHSNVTVDNGTGIFSGYAFLEDVGWVAFGTADNPLGPVRVNLTNGAVTGKAKSLSTGAYVDFTNYSSNVAANITTGVFSGNAFSEDMGWLNFSDTGISTSATLDAVAPLSFVLEGPGDKSYTNVERPTFAWKATTDATSGLSNYSVVVDNGDAGDFSFESIPPSRTTDYETTKYLAHYENFSGADTANRSISAYSRSTTDWGGASNDGKLKEGKRTWSIKAKDGVGNERIESRTLFVDRTGPRSSVTQVNSAPFTDSLATPDSTPTIFGRISDPLAGDKNENYAASGPKSAEVKIEKINDSGRYDLHSIATVNIIESYWADTGALISDDSKNSADKYATFSFTPSERLPSGSYRISVSGKDRAGNTGPLSSFQLKIITASDIASPEDKELIEKAKEYPEIVMEVPDEETAKTTAAVARMTQVSKDVYWQAVDWFTALAGSHFRWVENSISWLGASGRTAHGLEVKLLSIAEILFDNSPTVITNVKVAEVGKDFAVVTWNTNHFTTNNKVNYGETLSYGQDVLSQERSRYHEFKITGLEPNRKYYFEVMSHSRNYVYDAYHEFTTLSE